MQAEWRMVRESFTRPYRVPLSMVVLMALVPLYIFIADVARTKPQHRPEIALDRLIPLQPVWSLIYGALYLFLIGLPVLTVREDREIRRTIRAYLLIWLTAYVVFIVYPTAAPRMSDDVAGEGFGVWGLKLLYDADPPFNCFPSLHVAHSFVSAFAARRVHRRLGDVALIAATLVAISTLFTKQHWVVDVIAGIALALVACALFLRKPAHVPDLDRRVAPLLAATLGAIILAAVSGFWIVHRYTAAP